MKRLISPGLAILLFWGGAALAAEAPAQPAPDPESIKIAREILEATNSGATMMLMIDTMTPQILQNIKSVNPDVSDSVLKQFGAMFREEMAASLPQVIDMQAELYARHFSPGEMREIAKFYQSPVGKKAITEMPKIVQDAVPIGQAWGKSAGEAALKKVIETLRAQGVKI